MSSAAGSGAGGAGRGLALITLAKLYFILTGFVVQVGLPRLLGSPTAFGQYSLVMSIASVINNVLIAATVQSVSKRVSEDEGLAPARLRQGLALQLGVGIALALGLTALAPVLAGIAYDSELTKLLRIAAIVPLCYALYATLVGSLNGRRMFLHQAGLDITFSTLRTIGMLGGALLGFGAAGSISGFALGAVAILLVALGLVGIGKAGPQVPLRVWFGFLLPIVAFQLMLNGTLLLDVWVLNNTVAQMGLEVGLPVAEAAERASGYVGLYKAGQNFAFVPYQIILAVTFIVFPLVSRATASGDLDTARIHVRNALRFSIIVLFALAAPISGAAESLIRLAYGVKFLAGAETLRILVFGEVALALFVIVATILSGAGRPAASAWTGLVSLTVVLLANRFLVRSVGLHQGLLSIAAVATSLGPIAALALSAFVLRAVIGANLPYVTLVRSGVAAALAVYVARCIPQQTAWIAPLAMIASGITYLLTLACLGEIKKADLTAVVDSLRSRGKPRTGPQDAAGQSAGRAPS